MLRSRSAQQQSSQSADKSHCGLNSAGWAQKSCCKATIACCSTQCIVATCRLYSPDVNILMQEDVHFARHLAQCLCDMPSKSSSIHTEGCCMTHLIKSVTMSVQSPNIESSLCLRFPSVSFPPALQTCSQSCLMQQCKHNVCVGITESRVSMLSIQNVLKQSWAR